MLQLGRLVGQRLTKEWEEAGIAVRCFATLNAWETF